MFVPAQALVAQWLESFKEFPPRARPASFSIERVMDSLMPKLGYHTAPFFLIVFLLLGIAAGFVNVFRAAREMGEK